MECHSGMDTLANSLRHLYNIGFLPRSIIIIWFPNYDIAFPTNDILNQIYKRGLSEWEKAVDCATVAL